MSAPPLEYALLEGGPSSSHKSGYRRTAALAVLMAIVGSVGFLVGEWHGAQAEPNPELEAVPINNTELFLALFKEDCYGFTGGTCLAESCKPERKAVCQDGKCMCPNGCTGSDGTCRSSPYAHRASKISFRNGYWTSNWLYLQSVSLLSQLSVSGAPAQTFGGSQEFDVYELPGLINGRKQYFLASSKWPSWIAAIKSTGSVLSLSASLWGLYAVNLDHKVAPWDPQGIVVHICKIRAGPGEAAQDKVMIGSSGRWSHPIWAYVHRGSSFVYGWMLTSDPGSGGYWLPSGEIQGLQAC